MLRTALTAGLAFVLGFGAIPSAKAGLLDLLFGWADRKDVVAPAPHPDVTVSPAPVRKKVAKRKPAMTPQEQLARTIDPAKNPRWYLEDATLRKGDILVLGDRVVVFTGGELGAPKSYVSLSRTKLLTPKERERVAAMTGNRAETAPLIAQTAPSKLRKLKAAAAQTPAPSRG